MANYSQQQAYGVTNHNDWEVLNLVQGQNNDFGCQFQYVKDQNETDLLKIEEQAAVPVWVNKGPDSERFQTHLTLFI